MTHSFISRYGNWAVVTGASDGIGDAIAHHLAAQGLNLVLVARRQERLVALAQELMRQHGIQTLVLALDLLQSEAIESLCLATQDLDVGLLVAAAGFGTSGQFHQNSLDSELALLELNCRVPLMLSHHYGRVFADRGRGGIILFSSLVAFQGVPGATNYAASKAYIQSLAEGLHHELAPYGVDVVAAAPGPVFSGFADRAGMKMGLAARPEELPQEILQALGRRLTVRPGWLSKVLELSLALLPRTGRVRMMQKIMGGMIHAQPRANSGKKASAPTI